MWKVTHKILKPSDAKMNADPQLSNNFFNRTAHRILNQRSYRNDIFKN